MAESVFGAAEFVLKNNNMEENLIVSIKKLQEAINLSKVVIESHSNLLERVVEKLNTHDEMFVDTMNAVTENSKMSLENTKRISDILDHINVIYTHLNS